MTDSIAAPTRNRGWYVGKALVEENGEEMLKAR